MALLLLMHKLQIIVALDELHHEAYAPLVDRLALLPALHPHLGREAGLQVLRSGPRCTMEESSLALPRLQGCYASMTHFSSEGVGTRWLRTVRIDLQLAIGRSTEDAMHQPVIIIEQEDWQPAVPGAILIPLPFHQ